MPKSEPASSTETPLRVGKLIHDEGLVLAGDLERARELLRDAMGRIAGFVQLLQQGAERARSLTETGQPHADAAEIRKVLDGVQTEAAQAILGLQVEDVLGQLIEQTQRRVGALSGLGSSLAEMVDQHPSLYPTVDHLQTKITELQAERDRTMVSQESFEPGEAELF